MAEVQQTSDATFRLFDWNRADSDGHPRPLHRTEALACIDWSRGPVQPQVPQSIPNLPDGVSAHLLVDCPHFRLSRFQVDRAWQPPASGGLSAWIVLDGQIEVSTDTDSSPQAIERGGAVLIPSTVPNYCLCPMGRAALLHVTMGTPAVGASRIAARRSNGLLGHGSGITGGGRQAIGTATRRPARPCVADRKGEGTRHRPHEKSAESPSGERRRGRAWP